VARAGTAETTIAVADRHDAVMAISPTGRGVLAATISMRDRRKPDGTTTGAGRHAQLETTLVIGDQPGAMTTGVDRLAGEMSEEPIDGINAEAHHGVTRSGDQLDPAPATAMTDRLDRHAVVRGREARTGGRLVRHVARDLDRPDRATGHGV
jgi:hypothetical protein